MERVKSLLAGKNRRPWQIAITAALIPILSPGGILDPGIFAETSPSLLPARMDLFFERNGEHPEYTDAFRSQLSTHNIFEFKGIDQYLDEGAYCQMKEYSYELRNNLRARKEPTDGPEIACFFVTYRNPAAFIDFLKERGYGITKVSAGVHVAEIDPKFQPKLVIVSIPEVDPDVYPTLRLIAPGLAAETLPSVVEHAYQESAGEYREEVMQAVLLALSDADPEAFRALMEVDEVTMQVFTAYANDVARKKIALLEDHNAQLEEKLNRSETDNAQLKNDKAQLEEKLNQSERKIAQLEALVGQSQKPRKDE